MSLQPASPPLTSPAETLISTSNGPESNSPSLATRPAPYQGRVAPTTPSRLPRAKHWSRRTKLLLTLAVFLVLVAGAGAAYKFFGNPFKAPRADLVYHSVNYEALQLTIVERGQLESADNRDVICKVKAGNKGSTVATTIKWVIDDGSPVKQGQLIVELDDSGLQEQLKSQRIARDKASSDFIKAEEDYKILLSQNNSDIEVAKTDLEIAKLNLEKYLDGDYPQA